MKTRDLLYAFAIAALALVSCDKDKKPEIPESERIRFSAEDESSKALLTDNTLKTVGNRIHVMDVLSGFSGDATWIEDNLYVNDEIEWTGSGSTIWDYASGRIYPWTADGVHQFFAWLSYDAAMSQTADSFFGVTLADEFSPADKELEIPSFEMNTETPQFDFMYYGTDFYIMPRTVNQPVPLKMQHMFSALSLQFYNESQDEILITDVTISGIKNKKSATVSFLGTSTMSTTSQTASADFVDYASFNAQPAAVRTLAPGDKYDLLAGSKNTTAEYRLVWPQSEDDLAPSDTANYLTYPITVHYQYLADEEHINHTAHLRFPLKAEFKAGVRYAYTLIFTQKHIQLSFKVNPWNYDLNEWSFAEQSISEVVELDFAGNEGYDKPSKTCTIVGGNPVTGTFRVVNPSGAIWSIEPLGDVEYFTITPNQGIVDSENPNYEFQVIPNLDPSLDRSADKRLKFHFYVQFTSGAVHDANTEINRDDWTVILPKN